MNISKRSYQTNRVIGSKEIADWERTNGLTLPIAKARIAENELYHGFWDNK